MNLRTEVRIDTKDLRQANGSLRQMARLMEKGDLSRIHEMIGALDRYADIADAIADAFDRQGRVSVMG